MTRPKPIHHEAIMKRGETPATAQASRKGPTLYDNVIKQFSKAAG
jgi:hypothetical protein